MLAEALLIWRLDTVVKGANVVVVARCVIRARLAQTALTLSIGASACGTVASIRGAKVTIRTVDLLGDAKTLKRTLVNGAGVAIVAIFEGDAGDVTVYLRSGNTGTNGLLTSSELTFMIANALSGVEDTGLRVSIFPILWDAAVKRSTVLTRQIFLEVTVRGLATFIEAVVNLLVLTVPGPRVTSISCARVAVIAKVEWEDAFAGRSVAVATSTGLGVLTHSVVSAAINDRGVDT